jgi:hypothetical protein
LTHGKVLAQFDGLPWKAYPTSHWFPANLSGLYRCSSRRCASVPYRVFLGLYNETTGNGTLFPATRKEVMLNVE